MRHVPHRLATALLLALPLAACNSSAKSDADAKTPAAAQAAPARQPAQTLTPGSAGDYYWGGMFSTGFFVDPVEQICMVFMTQLMPSSTYPVRHEVKTLVHAALND